MRANIPIKDCMNIWIYPNIHHTLLYIYWPPDHRLRDTSGLHLKLIWLQLRTRPVQVRLLNILWSVFEKYRGIKTRDEKLFWTLQWRIELINICRWLVRRLSKWDEAEASAENSQVQQNRRKTLFLDAIASLIKVKSSKHQISSN